MSKTGRNYKLRQAREMRGWTQKDVADHIELPDVRTFRRWESGDALPSLRYRAKLCDVFEMDVEQLGFVTGEQRRVEASETIEDNQLDDASVDARQDDTLVPEMLAGGRGKALLKQQSTQQWNRQRFLERVRTFWIKEVLECSFKKCAPITLKVQQCNEDVVSLSGRWDERIDISSRGRVYPPMQERDEQPEICSIVQAYDDACGELLIVGKTGAGKTTLLLELARELLRRASENDAHPMPVVFGLASWQERRLSSGSLADWMVEELNTKYYVPKRIGVAWVKNDAILPLLDGLEDVSASVRGSCVDAINTYRVEHGLVPIVVCCHQDEYLRLHGTLALSHAVCLQPLTPEQVDAYLEEAGESCEELRLALRDNRDLRQMVSTPLALRTMMRAYERGVEGRLIDRYGCAPYIERMFERHQNRYPYSLQQSMHWLARLARQSKRGYQAGTQPEQVRERYIQPQLQLHWLPSVRLQRLCLGVFLGVWAALLSSGLIGMIALSQGDSLVQSLLITPGLAMSVGCITGLVWALGSDAVGRSMRKAISGMLLGTTIGGCSIVLGHVLPSGGEIDSLLWGTTIGATIDLFFLFLYLKNWSFEHVSWSRDAVQVEWHLFSRKSLYWMVGIGIVGGCFGWFVAQLGPCILYIELCAVISLLIVHFLQTMRGEKQRETRAGSISCLLRRGIGIGLFTWLFLLVGSIPFLLFPFGFDREELLCIPLAFTLATWLLVGVWRDGEACMRFGLLRCMLWMVGTIPWNYTQFLDCAVEQTLLIKSKRGYRFTSRVLLDYFASLEEAQQEDGNEWGSGKQPEIRSA